MPDYVWLNGPPVVQLGPEEVPVRAKVFRANVKAYAGGVRDGDTDFIAKILQKKGSDVVFEYRLDGAPVALLGLNIRSAFEIKYLVTHPGSENAGGIMVELAVRVATKNGFGTQVWLESYNDDSTAAYLALGFEKKGKGMDMCLDAATSPLWEPVGDTYRLKKYADKKVLGTNPV